MKSFNRYFLIFLQQISQNFNIFINIKTPLYSHPMFIQIYLTYYIQILEMNRPNTSINIGKFSYFLDQSLGKGATGQVFRGINNYTNETVAIKVVILRGIDTPRKRQLLDCQINGLRSVHHPNVIEAYDITQDNEHLYIPMQCCPNGTLRDYIKSKKYLSDNEALHIFEKIVNGYCQIVKSGFIHRDLKTQNILLRKNMDPVIIDFGYCEKAKTQYQKLSYNVGSPAYMSPQAYNDSIYSQKSDIWALGVILHEMTTGTIPKMWTMDVNRYFKELSAQKNAVIVPAYQSQFCMNLLSMMLTVNINHRPTGEQTKRMLKQKTLQKIPNELQKLNFRTKSMKQIPLKNLSFSRNPSNIQYSQKHQKNLINNENDFSYQTNEPISEKYIPTSPTKMLKNNGGIEMGNSINYTPNSDRKNINKKFENLRNKIITNQPLKINETMRGLRETITMTPLMKKKPYTQQFSPLVQPHSAVIHRSISYNQSQNSQINSVPRQYKQSSYPESISSFDSPLRKSFPVKLRRQISTNELRLNRI